MARLEDAKSFMDQVMEILDTAPPFLDTAEHGLVVNKKNDISTQKVSLKLLGRHGDGNRFIRHNLCLSLLQGWQGHSFRVTHNREALSSTARLVNHQDTSQTSTPLGVSVEDGRGGRSGPIRMVTLGFFDR